MEYYQAFRYGDKEGRQVEERIYYTKSGRKTDLMDHEGDASHAEKELPPKYFAVFMLPVTMGALPVRVGEQTGVTPHVVLTEHFVEIPNVHNPHDAIAAYNSIAESVKSKMEQTRKQSQLAIAKEIPTILKS